MPLPPHLYHAGLTKITCEIDREIISYPAKGRSNWLRYVLAQSKNGKSTNLNMKAAAVLVWLDDGENPALDSFVPQLVQPPPSPNPESWWCLEDAIAYAYEIDKRDHRKVPWIKAGDTILGPDQIIQAYKVRFAGRG
jgi:hypothetical protein